MGGFARSQEATDSKPAESGEAHGRLVLVLPFENRSGDKSNDWMGSAFPDVLNRRLSSAGFLTIGRGDRLYAFDHLGLPPICNPRVPPLSACADARRGLCGVGHFARGTDAAPNQLTAEALTLDVSGLRLSEPIEQQGDADHLVQMINSLSWKVARQLNPALGVDEQTFIAADRNLHTEAFRDYIRGWWRRIPKRTLGTCGTR